MCRWRHPLPFWKNSSSLSLKGWRYSFGDSLHTTIICFSLAVKGSLELDLLKNMYLLSCGFVLCSAGLIVQNPDRGKTNKNRHNTYKHTHKHSEFTPHFSSGTKKCTTFNFPFRDAEKALTWDRKSIMLLVSPKLREEKKNYRIPRGIKGPDPLQIHTPETELEIDFAAIPRHPNCLEPSTCQEEGRAQPREALILLSILPPFPWTLP